MRLKPICLIFISTVFGISTAAQAYAPAIPGAFSVSSSPLVGASAGTTSLGNIKLPDHIPANCVRSAATRYKVPEMALLAILKQESGGRVGIVSANKNGSKDYGPAQLNDRSWGKYMQSKYGISLDSLTNNMCQALMSQAYALRSELNRCIKKGNNSIWCAIAYYHSPTKKFQDRYVKGVWKQYQNMITRGSF